MHPLNKILCFLLLLSAISIANNTIVLLTLVSLLICMLAFKVYPFLHAVKRMRWLFLSLVIIYAYGTPGELVPLFPVGVAPSYEGLYLAVLQITKLLIALAALSLLMVSTPSQQMLLGLYLMLLPFKWIGFNVERFAARLMLTLDYVEELAANEHRFFNFKNLAQIATQENTVSGAKEITLQRLPFNLLNKGLMLLLPMLFIYVIYEAFT